MTYSKMLADLYFEFVSLYNEFRASQIPNF